MYRLASLTHCVIIADIYLIIKLDTLCFIFTIIAIPNCGELTVTNGVADYTNLFRLGSVATYTCNEGYMQANPGTTQTCTVNGWSGSSFTCTG